MTISRGGWAWLAVAFVSAAAVVELNIHLVPLSSISSVAFLHYDLAPWPLNNPSWIDDWLFHQDAPFKYRVGGKWVVYGIYRTLCDFGYPSEYAFYAAFIASLFIGLLLSSLAVAAFTRLLLENVAPSADRKQLTIFPLLAMLLFTLSPPILLLGKWPSHMQPGDLLGYSFMFATVYLAAQQRLVASLACAVAGVLCRETALLAPFVILFCAHVTPRWRLILASVPALLIVALRIGMGGTYDPTSGAQENFDAPYEAAGFALMTFGPMWLLGTFGYLSLRTAATPQWLTGYVHSFPLGTTLTLVIVFFLARVCEMRLLYVLCIWFMPLSAVWIYLARERIKHFLKSWRWYGWLIAVAISVGTIRLKFMAINDPAFERWLISKCRALYVGLGYDPELGWLGVAAICLFLLFACLPWRFGPSAARA